jgi:hypothetical protein
MSWDDLILPRLPNVAPPFMDIRVESNNPRGNTVRVLPMMVNKPHSNRARTILIFPRKGSLIPQSEKVLNELIQSIQTPRDPWNKSRCIGLELKSPSFLWRGRQSNATYAGMILYRGLAMLHKAHMFLIIIRCVKGVTDNRPTRNMQFNMITNAERDHVSRLKRLTAMEAHTKKLSGSTCLIKVGENPEILEPRTALRNRSKSPVESRYVIVPENTQKDSSEMFRNVLVEKKVTCYRVILWLGLQRLYQESGAKLYTIVPQLPDQLFPMCCGMRQCDQPWMFTNRPSSSVKIPKGKGHSCFVC